MKKRIGLLLCLLLATVCAFALADAATQAADDRLQLTVDGGAEITLPVYDSCTFHLHVEGQPNEVRLVLDKAYDVTNAFENSQDADFDWMTFDIGEGEYTWPVYAEVSYEGEDGPVYSNPVNMTVTFGEELPGELTYTVMTGTSLPRDGKLTLAVDPVEGAEYYEAYVGDYYTNWKTKSEWVPAAESGKTTVSMPLNALEPGEYDVHVYACAAGRPRKDAAEPIHITVKAPYSADPIILTSLKRSYLTMEPILISATFDNKDNLENLWMYTRIYMTDDPNNQPYEDWSEIVYQGQCDWIGDTGDYTLEVTVYQDVEDEEPIALYTRKATFSVTANGEVVIDMSGIPATLTAGKAASFTVSKPENAEAYNINVWTRDEAHEHIAGRDDITSDTYTVEIPAEALVAGEQLDLTFYGYGHGMQSDWQNVGIPVVPAADARATITVSSNTVLCNDDFEVSVSATGNEAIRQLRLFDGNRYWDDEGIDEDGTWIRTLNHWEPRTYAIFALVTFDDWKEEYDGLDYDPRTWVSTNIEEVTVTSNGTAGEFTFSLDKTEINRGDNLTITYNPSENADHYWVDFDILRTDEEGNTWYDWMGNAGHLNDPAGGTVTVPTAFLEPGTYNVHAGANAAGYENRNTPDIVLTVKDGTVPESGVLFTVDKTAVVPQERVSFSAYAPGASWIEVCWDCANDEWYDGHWDGESFSDDRTPYDQAGTYQAVAIAHFGSDESGEWVESEVKVSDPVTFTVTADGEVEIIAPDDLPASLTAGEALNFTVQRPVSAEAYNVNVCIDGQDGNLTVAYNLTDATKPFTVPADQFNEGDVLRINIYGYAYGLNSAWQEWKVPVVAAPDSRVALSVSAHESLVNQDIRITVTAAEGKKIKSVRFFDGNGFNWGEQEPDNDTCWTGNLAHGGAGTYTVYAQVTFDEWKEEYEGMDPDPREWLTTNTETVTFTKNGTVGDFSIALDKTKVARGEDLKVTYTKAANAERYWVDFNILRTDEEGNSWYDWMDHLGDLEDPNGGTVTINTTSLEPGEYRVYGQANAVGYEGHDCGYVNLTVTEAQMPESNILAKVSKNEIETGEEYQLSVYAPGAEWIEFFFDYEHGTGWRDDRGGDTVSWNRSDYRTAGEYQLQVRAWYNELDENGQPIMETNDEGEEYTKQYSVDADPITMKVTAPNGDLAFEAPDLPATLAAGDAVEVSFTVRKPEAAEWMEAYVWIDGEEQNLFEEGDFSGEALSIQVAPALSVGQTLRIRLQAIGYGWNEANTNFSIPVLAAASEQAVLLVGEGDMDSEGNVPIHGNVQFLIGAADGAELTAAKFYTGEGWWSDEEVNRGNHPDWFDENGNAFFWTGFHDEGKIGQDVTVYGMARLNGSEEWVSTEPMVVHIKDFEIGEYDFVSLEPITVMRGENVTFTFTAAENADNYWIDAWDNDGNGYNPGTSCDGTTVTLNTAQLPEGEFIIRGRAGADGKGWRESSSEVRLVVTATDVPAGEIQLKTEKTQLQTCENLVATIVAPGAIKVGVDTDGDRHDIWHDENTGDGGEGWDGDMAPFDWHSWSESGTHTVTPWALYEEGGEWQSGEPVTITVTSNGQKIAIDTGNIPETAKAGEDLNIRIPWPENASKIGWNCWVEVEDGWGEGGGNDFGEGIDITVPADAFSEGDRIALDIWADAVGYEHNHVSIRIPVIAETSAEKVTISVSKSEVLVYEPFTVTVSSPGADYIQYYNGYDFWNDNGEINNLELDENGTWSIDWENYNNTGKKTLYARAMIDGTLYTSEPVTVNVTSNGSVGAFTAATDDTTVLRGESLKFTFTESENADDYWVDLDRKNDKGEWEWWSDVHRDTTGRTCTLYTENLEAGEYCVRGQASGLGYEQREADNVLYITVLPPAEGITLSVDHSAAQTNESIRVNAYAPGADSLQVFWNYLNDQNDVWDNGEEGGDSASWDHGYQDKGTYEILVRAYYPDGSTLDSDPFYVTISSSGKKLVIDSSTIPSTITEGTDLVFSVPYPDEATYFGYFVQVNGTDLDDIGGEYINGNPLDIFVSSDHYRAEDIITVGIWTSGIGYDHNHTNYQIPVVTEPSTEVSIVIEEAQEYLPNTSYTVTVSAENAEKFKFYNGYGFETDWYTNGDEYMPDENGQCEFSVSYGEPGAYTLYAMAWFGDGDTGAWVNSPVLTLTIAEGPEVTLPEMTIPTVVKEGNEAVITIGAVDDDTDYNLSVSQQNGINIYNYHAWQDPEGDYDPSVENRLTISSDLLYVGTYTVDIDFWQPGHKTTHVTETFQVLSEPSIALSVSKKTIKYGETLTITVMADGASEYEIGIWEGEGVAESLPANTNTWTADRIGRVSFVARATFPGFDESVTTTETTDITVRSLGAAPKPTVNVPSEVNEGTDLAIVISDVNGWYHLTVTSGEETKLDVESSENGTQTVGGLAVGTYTASLTYGKDGYDDGQAGPYTIIVKHVPQAEIVWTNHTAKLIVTCASCGETLDTVDCEVTSEVKAVPNCSADGLTVWTAAAAYDGQTYTDTEEETTTAPDAHDWNEAEYMWADDLSSVTATITCKHNAAHIRVTETVNNVTSAVTKEATCEEQGETTYTAAFENEAFTAQTKVIAIEALGHAWGEVGFKWSEDGHSATAFRACNRCEEKKTFETAMSEEVITAPTCTDDGESTFTAKATVEGTEHTDSNTATVAKLGHDWGDWTVTTPATCDTAGVESSECARCPNVRTRSIPATGNHVWGEWTIITEATCTTEGLKTHECSNCHKTESEIIPALNHSWGEVTYTWAEDNSSVTATRVCAFDAEHVETETVNTTSEITKAATDTEKGETTYTSAAFTDEAFAVQTKVVEIPALMTINEAGVLTAYSGNASAITIPGSVTAIGEGVFQGMSNITSVTIPSSVTTIGANAFAGTSITSVDIGATVISIGSGAFNAGTTINTPGSSAAAAWAAANGCTVNDTTPATPTPTAAPTATPTAEPTATPTAEPTAEPTVTPVPTMPSSVTDSTGSYSIGSDGTATFSKPAGSAATVTIPATINVNGQDIPVTAIADNAFKGNKKLTTVTIGKNIKTIGKNAFASCAKLKTVKGGANVVTIKDGAFSGCKVLKTFPAMNKLQKIGNNAFKGAKALAKFTLAKTVTNIGKNAFNGCAGLKTITVKTEKLTSKNVGAGAFKGINKKATFKCPKKQLKNYKTLFVKKGAPKTCKFK